MGTMIELDTATRLRITEMRLSQTEAVLEARLAQMVELIDDRNRLVAEVARSRQANRDLLARIDAITGYPGRVLLGA